MKLYQVVLISGFLMLCNAIFAQTMSSPESEVRRLFDEFSLGFNNQESEELARSLIGTPLTMRDGENVTLVTSEEKVIETLDGLFDRIKQKGWVRSKVLSTNVCTISDNIVFLDNEYSRLKADGTAIPPEVRRTLQVWQRSNEEWRIVSFVFHDASVVIGCE